MSYSDPADVPIDLSHRSSLPPEGCMTALSHRCLLGCLLLLAPLLLAGRAEAGPLLDTATDCDRQTLERPFLPWADPAHYVLMPDGTFSARAAGWRLSGARVVAENEPYYVHGDDRPAALAVASGGSVASPAMCVGIQHPTLRFFARSTGSELASLRVEVLFEDAAGDIHSLPIGEVPARDAWAPTPPLPVVANLLALLPDERTAIAFRFTPQGADSSWLIDDVYVDPYGKG
jgi:hypothetical protein